jgi:hypothetical protein
MSQYPSGWGECPICGERSVFEGRSTCGCKAKPDPPCPDCARLREALAPFAKAYRDWYEDCRRHGFGYGPNAHNRVTVADFERAAKASEEGR